MSTFPRAMSIRLKVIILVTALLGIMVAAAVYSYLESRQAIEVRQDMEDLTAFLLPIVGAIANIEIHTLEQQIHLERAMELLLSPEPNGDDGIQRELSEFERWGDRIRGELTRVDAQIEQAVLMLEQETHRVLISRIDPLVEQVGQQHSSFETYFRSAFQEAQDAETEEIRSHQVSLRNEQAKLDALLDVVLQDIQSLQQGIALELDTEDRQLSRRSQQIVGLALAALLLGISLALVVTRRMLKPIEALKEGTERVAKGDLNTRVDIRTMDEMGQLASSFNSMVGGLREREKLQTTFGRYVDPRIVQHLLKAAATEVGDRRVMTAFFSDIKDFTTISERLSPDILVKLVNAYLSDLSGPIQQQDGVIDKFIGDSIMAFWGPPFVSAEEQATKACRAAMASLEVLPSFQRRVADLTGITEDTPQFAIRIGIATGPMIVGSIGSERSKNYTVLGDTVNLASRLEGACKVYSVHCLVSEETRDRVQSGISFREVDLLQVKGKSEPIRVYEPILSGSNVAQSFYRQYEEALNCYRNRDWDGAVTRLEVCLDEHPEDGPSQVLLVRSRQLQQHAPGSDWDGVWRLETK